MIRDEHTAADDHDHAIGAASSRSRPVASASGFAQATPPGITMDEGLRHLGPVRLIRRPGRLELHGPLRFGRPRPGRPSWSPGAASRFLTDWLGPTALRKFGVRFTRQVWPGDSLTSKAEVTAIEDEGGLQIVTLSVVTTNQNGESVVEGEAVAAI